MTKVFFAVALFPIALSAGAQTVPGSQVSTFQQVVDRAIVQESKLLAALRNEHPIAETYIQDMGKDADFGNVPRVDHYFLGKVDISHGVNTNSFIPKSREKTGGFAFFTNLFSVKYLPRGFAQTMLIDDGAFDRGHYDFEYVRREYLGDVRALRGQRDAEEGSGGRPLHRTDLDRIERLQHRTF
jgi:hypothetical protein